MKKSIFSTIAALSLCLCMPAPAHSRTPVAARQNAHSVRIKVDRDLVEEVQLALLALGYDVEKADGDFGSKTKRALRTLQKSQGLPATGQINSATLAHLRRLIRSVQRALMRKGYDVSVIDGTFGPSTKRALQRFQKAQRLPVTGLMNRRTLKALRIGQKKSGGTGKSKAPDRQRRRQSR